MSEAAELASVNFQLKNISALPVQFPDDYQQPPHNQLKKVPIVPVDLPEPPARKADAETTLSESIELVFKVTKPTRSFTISVLPTEAVSSIKSQLASQPGAPPADAQRLLLRGKALADSKLLKEYPVKGGDTVNLMLKPGFEWNWDATTSTSASASMTPASTDATPSSKDKDGDVQMSLEPGSDSTRRGRHGRIPSVVLSPSPSPSSRTLPLDNLPSPIPLTLDTSIIPSAGETAVLDAYQKKISSPEFWERLYTFLTSEFEHPRDADEAFEAFLLGSKGSLSASDVAKIRDRIGIIGMNGS